MSVFKDMEDFTMNDMQIFNHAEFGSVRTLTINGEIYFVGKDVADILKYQNGSRDINRHVAEEDRMKTMVFDGTQNKETIIINESGLYALILGSKLPAAKACSCSLPLRSYCSQTQLCR